MHVVVLSGEEATCGPLLFAVCPEHCNGNVINEGMSFKLLFFFTSQLMLSPLKKQHAKLDVMFNLSAVD